jgi:hypothetical protein
MRVAGWPVCPNLASLNVAAAAGTTLGRSLVHTASAEIPKGWRDSGHSRRLDSGQRRHSVDGATKGVSVGGHDQGCRGSKQRDTGSLFPLITILLDVDGSEERLR